LPSDATKHALGEFERLPNVVLEKNTTIIILIIPLPSKVK
jgi:hypothetical protein